MKALSMDRLLTLDEICGGIVHTLLEDGLSLSSMMDETNYSLLCTTAERLGVKREDFFSYVWLRASLHSVLVWGNEDPEGFWRYEDYLRGLIRKHREELEGVVQDAANVQQVTAAS